MKFKMLIITLVLIIDILSKQMVVHTMLEEESINIINNFFSITYAKNTGVAFSFLDGKVPLIIIATSIIILLILRHMKANKLSKCEGIFYSLVIGGSLGNLIDRIVYGYVIDFLDFNIFGYNFAIFNLADTAIVIGIFGLIILSFIESRNEDETNSKRKEKNR